MHAQSTAGQLAGLAPTDLVLERLPSGEFAWLRPEAHSARTVDSPSALDEARFTITQRGRDDLARERREHALESLFSPWPTVAQTGAIGVCGACHHLLTRACANDENRG